MAPNGQGARPGHRPIPAMQHDQDKHDLEEALEVAKATGDRLDHARRLLDLGRYEVLHGDAAKARAHYQAAFALGRKAIDRANAKLGLGDLERLFGDRSAARAHYESALDLYRQGGDAMGEAHALHSLGDLERLFGDRSAARAYYEPALD
ncbi:MAG: tetratricopeptide repeat protein, partial [Acidimicrobiales bacterium]